jgi:hypothetical protein
MLFSNGIGVIYVFDDYIDYDCKLLLFVIAIEMPFSEGIDIDFIYVF